MQSIAQTSTNKKVFRMLQPYQFSMSQFQISSIIVPLAHEMWKHQWNLQHGPTTSSGGNIASVPQLWYFCKGGAGAKNIFFEIFFLRNPFLRRARSQKLIFFLRFFALRQNNTLDRELIISANNWDSHGS